jgi:hypothetical protein
MKNKKSQLRKTLGWLTPFAPLIVIFGATSSKGTSIQVPIVIIGLVLAVVISYFLFRGDKT